MSELTEEILELKSEGEMILFMDGNAKIGLMNETVSRNGKLLNQVIKETAIHVVNGTDKCQGLVTRQNRKKLAEKSAIDFVMVSYDAEKWIKEMIIDEEGEFRARGKNESDHNSIIVRLELEDFDSTEIRKKRCLESESITSAMEPIPEADYEQNRKHKGTHG